jgi:hypothetical protein
MSLAIGAWRVHLDDKAHASVGDNPGCDKSDHHHSLAIRPGNDSMAKIGEVKTGNVLLRVDITALENGDHRKTLVRVMKLRHCSM